MDEANNRRINGLKEMFNALSNTEKKAMIKSFVEAGRFDDLKQLGFGSFLGFTSFLGFGSETDSCSGTGFDSEIGSGSDIGFCSEINSGSDVDSDSVFPFVSGSDFGSGFVTVWVHLSFFIHNVINRP